MSMQMADSKHEVLYQDLCKLCSNHAEKLSAQELLAVAANMLGKLIAMQDQRTMSPALAMEIVAKNIECGNQQVLAQLLKSDGNA